MLRNGVVKGGMVRIIRNIGSEGWYGKGWWQ